MPFLLASNFLANVEAQEVIAPPPQFSVAPPAAQEMQTNNEMDVFVPETIPGSQEQTQPFRYKLFTLRPHPFYSFIYATGILSASNQPEDTLIQELSPGFLLEIGTHWTLDYTPIWMFYSNDHFQNNLAHAVTLTGETTFENWAFNLSQNFTLSSAPEVETGTQTSQKTYTTALNASYIFNSKVSADFGVNQNFILVDQFASSRVWSTLDWLNYQFWPRLDVGVGVGFKYVNLDPGSDMTAEQLQARIGWRATDKIRFQIHAGGEDRQFLTGGQGDLLNPVFGASIQYQPFEATKISISANRTIDRSAFYNQISENTDFTGDLNQRLLKKLYLDLSGGYHTSEYVATTVDTLTDRTDDYYSFNVQLRCPFPKRGTLAAFYQISDNSSTQSAFSYTSSQFGFEISYQY
jgi:Putative beta-barrel porin 2